MHLGVAAAVVGGVLVAGDVDVEDGRVEAVGLPAAARSHIALPGFVDVHLHGHAGTDFTDAGDDDYHQVARSITSSGVTAFQPTLMSIPVDDLLAAMSIDPVQSEDGARVLGFHLEGPFLSPERPGAHQVEHLIHPTAELVRRFLDTGRLAQVTIAPELPGAILAIDMLVGAGVAVSLGHSVADAAITSKALRHGASAFTHVFNAMAVFSHRQPGILGAALASHDAYLTGIFDGVHLSDEAAVMLIRCGGTRLVAITDGTAALGRGGAPVLGHSHVEIHPGAPRLVDGTLAGSILTMDQAFRNLLRLGCDVQSASRATSTAPAELAGLPPLTLEPGSRADIVVLDEGYQVAATYVGGVETYTA